MLREKKILVINIAGLGDLIMLTPSLRNIKLLYPSCKVSVLTKPVNKDALINIPYIHHVYTMQRKSLVDKMRIIASLSQFDYVIFTTYEPQLAWMSRLLNIPNRIGLYKEKYRNSKLFHKHIHTWVLDTLNPVAETINNAFSNTLGIQPGSDIYKCDVSIPGKEEIERVDRLLEKHNLNRDAEYICFAPFTGVEEKNWPIEHCYKLCTMIQENLNIPVLLIGPPDKVEIASTIGASNLVGKTSMLEMIEIIRRASLLICCDSGPMHIAGAVGTPQIALFSKEIPSRWAPRNQCKAISLALPCSPCGDEIARNCPTLECIRGITPEMVFPAVQEQLLINSYSKDD